MYIKKIYELVDFKSSELKIKAKNWKGGGALPVLKRLKKGDANVKCFFYQFMSCKNLTTIK